jgi:hypothetical protein
MSQQSNRQSKAMKLVGAPERAREAQRSTVRRAAWCGSILLALYALAVGGSGLWVRATASPGRCPAAGAVVLVDTAARTLCLCEHGAVHGQFRVALGRGGIGKRSEGDDRTPIGTYALSNARPSERFGLFLPIAYPTAEQRRRGFTGSAVGVHGPHRAFRWLRHATVWLDWTAGCIAVGTDSDIETIGKWVAARGATDIVIS